MISNKDELREFYRGVTPRPDTQLREWIAKFQSGADGSERLSTLVIRDFILRQLLGEPQSQVTLEWLAEAFDKILKFDDARVALRLPKRPRHRPTSPDAAQLAIDVTCWAKVAIDRGYSESEANRLAGKVFAREERSIQRMRESAAGWIESMNPDVEYWEKYFSLKSRPLPPPKAQSDTKS